MRGAGFSADLTKENKRNPPNYFGAVLFLCAMIKELGEEINEKQPHSSY